MTLKCIQWWVDGGSLTLAGSPSRKRKTPTENLEQSPKGGQISDSVLPLAAPASASAPNVVPCTPLDSAGKVKRGGGPVDWAVQGLHIFCPGMYPGEATPVMQNSESTTQETAVTGDKSRLDWCRVECHWLSSWVGGSFMSH